MLSRKKHKNTPIAAAWRCTLKTEEHRRGRFLAHESGSPALVFRPGVRPSLGLENANPAVADLKHNIAGTDISPCLRHYHKTSGPLHLGCQ